MKTNSLFWALSWVAVGSFAAMQGCGGDDDDDGGDPGSTGGKGGSAGSGTGGKGGSAGSSTGGKGGSAGSSTGGTSGAGGAPGGAGGEGGNSVGGEGGGGTVDPERVAACGVYCTSYFAHTCETFGTDTYDDVATCQSTCEGASWGIGQPGVVGNTVMCRLSHADLAVAPDQELHCGHASENPTGVCVD